MDIYNALTFIYDMIRVFLYQVVGRIRFTINDEAFTYLDMLFVIIVISFVIGIFWKGAKKS